MNKQIKGAKELHKIIESSAPKVFIVGHNDADFDSIGSAIALQAFCTALGKQAYIIINDLDIMLEPGVKKIKDRNLNSHNIITMEQYQSLRDKNSTLIVTDTNKKNLVAVKDNLDDFANIIIIDHHQEDENTIENASCYINENLSSASEVVSRLLINSKISFDSDIYTYLFAGIILDTASFKKNTTSNTHDVAKLLSKKADRDYINELFLADFDSDRIVNNLVFNGTLIQAYEFSLVQNHNISFTLNREKPTTIYRREQLAKAADKMLKYSIAACFTLGYVDESTVVVCARSKGALDVGKIMKTIGGGGNAQNAGAKVCELPIEEVEEILKTNINFGVNIDGNPAPPEEGKPIKRPKRKIKV